MHLILSGFLCIVQNLVNQDILILVIFFYNLSLNNYVLFLMELHYNLSQQSHDSMHKLFLNEHFYKKNE